MASHAALNGANNRLARLNGTTLTVDRIKFGDDGSITVQSSLMKSHLGLDQARFMKWVSSSHLTLEFFPFLLSL